MCLCIARGSASLRATTHSKFFQESLNEPVRSQGCGGGPRAIQRIRPQCGKRRRPRNELGAHSRCCRNSGAGGGPREDVGARSIAAGARLRGRARSLGRRTARCPGERRAHRAGRSGCGQREVRDSPYRRGQRIGEDGARKMTAMAQPASPLSIGSLTQLTLSLVAIVALILAIGWVLKRFKLNAPRGSVDSEILDQLSVGPRERVLLIRIGEAQVLLGVGAGGIVALTPLSAPIQLKASGRAPAFAERLRDMMKRPGGAP